MSTLFARVPLSLARIRADRVVATLFPDYSRARLQQWIRRGFITANGRPVTMRQQLTEGTELVLDLDQAEQQRDDYTDQQHWLARRIPLQLVYCDDDLLVIDKQPGMVMHPAPGHREDTLANAVLCRWPDQQKLPRSGLVHRLDKDTGGLVVVARNLPAHSSLVRQLQARRMTREYRAVVTGVIRGSGEIDAPLGRDPGNRMRRSVISGGKPACSLYRVLHNYRRHSLLNVQLRTGRTHQIRAHFAHLGYPLVGDRLYGARPHLPPAASEELRRTLQNFNRQALHAVKLGVEHPRSGEQMIWYSDLPEDMVRLIALLTADRQ